MNEPREPERAGKIESDDDGQPLNGTFVFNTRCDDHFMGIVKTFYFFNNGKLHGTPAIIYPDGREEDWDNGVFIKMSTPPYTDR